MAAQTFRISAGNFLSLPSQEEIGEGEGFFWFEPYEAICYKKGANSFIAVLTEDGKYIKHNEQSVYYKAHDEMIAKLNAATVEAFS